MGGQGSGSWYRFDSKTTTDSKATTKTVVPPLQKLELPVTDEQWSEWVEQYGLDVVLERAQWYHYAHTTGKANGIGWLRSCLEEGWTEPPAGYERSDNAAMGDGNRRNYFNDKYRDEIEY